MHAVGADRQGDVAASVDDDAHGAPRGGVPGSLRHRVRECEQCVRLESALPNLDPVHPGLYGSGDTLFQWAAGGSAIRHQAKNGSGSRDQKLASPSVGLDAAA